jgi:hypothetical protein
MRKAAWIAAVLALMLVSFNVWAVEGKDTNCNRDGNHFGDDLQTYTAQEQFTVPMGSGTLQVTAAHNGGVKLIGGDGNQYEVTVCKYAGADSQSEADQILKQITAEHSSNTIGVQGPDADHWTASLIIRVPKGANMSVSAHNGPVSAKAVSGTFDLNSVNGPISVKEASGKLTAKAHNGPISFTGDSGDYNFETQNGPISIELASSSWQNGKLDARANNGPISLKLPTGYQSGVVLTSDGHAPMSCSAEVCKQARKTWEGDEKRIEFGPANALIHISTHNGPVSVSTRNASM